MKVKIGLYPNCSEWNEDVEPDWYRGTTFYPNDDIKEEIKKQGWDK